MIKVSVFQAYKDTDLQKRKVSEDNEIDMNFETRPKSRNRRLSSGSELLEQNTKIYDSIIKLDDTEETNRHSAGGVSIQSDG